MTRLAAVAVVVLLADGLEARPPETFAPEGGGFQVKFPGKPREAKTDTDTGAVKFTVFTATYATRAGNVFMVSYTEFPEGTVKPENRTAVLDGVRNGLKGKDGTVLTDNPVEVGAEKVPGQELVIEKGKKQVRIRIVLRGDRLYQVAVVGTKDFVAAENAETEAFLKSFEIKK